MCDRSKVCGKIIAQNFPLLSLEQVYGTIAFYLANREIVDAYLEEGAAEFKELQQSLRQKWTFLSQQLITAQTRKKGVL